MRLLSNNKGFSILEAIVAVTVMLIGSLAFMQLMSAQSNEVSRMKTKLSIIDLGREVRYALGDANNCRFNLSSNGTATINASAIPNLTDGKPLDAKLLTPAVIYEAATVTSRKIAETGTVLGGNDPKIESMWLSNWMKKAANAYVADLTVSFHSRFGPLAPMIVKGINFRTTGPTNAKVIQACSTDSLPLSVSAWLGITRALGNYTFTYPGTKTPVMLTGYTTLNAAGSTVCLLQARWLDSKGNVLQDWQTLAGSNPAGGPDGKAFINSGFPLAVTFIPNATQIAFRSSGSCNGGGATLYLHTLLEQ